MGPIAQLVERVTLDLGVVSSNPTEGRTYFSLFFVLDFSI